MLEFLVSLGKHSLLIFRKMLPYISPCCSAACRRPTRRAGVAGEAKRIMVRKRVRCANWDADFLSFIFGW